MTNQIINIPPEDIVPWERIKSESYKAYAAFVVYSKLPPRDRSLRKAAKQHYGEEKYNLSKSSKIRQFQKWSSNFMWVDRAGAWDEYKVEVDREAELKAIIAMNKEHIKMAKGLASVAVKRLEGMDEEELSPEAVLRYIIEAARIERQARGEPDTIVETQSETDIVEETYAEMTDGDLIQRIIKRRIERKRIDNETK